MSEPERKNNNNNNYNFTILTQNVTITEMSAEQEHGDGESSASRKKYIVQEPMDQLDFIFEPEHYKVTKESVRETSLNDAKLENKFTHARVVSENDEGFLQYEYQSYTYVNKNYSDKKADVSQDDFEFCGNDFDIMHHHLDAIVRGEIFLF